MVDKHNTDCRSHCWRERRPTTKAAWSRRKQTAGSLDSRTCVAGRILTSPRARRPAPSRFVRKLCWVGSERCGSPVRYTRLQAGSLVSVSRALDDTHRRLCWISRARIARRQVAVRFSRLHRPHDGGLQVLAAFAWVSAMPAMSLPCLRWCLAHSSHHIIGREWERLHPFGFDLAPLSSR